jgi:hypothetical protein
MNKTLISVIGFLALSFGANASIVSPAQSGKQCSADRAVSLYCGNPDGYDKEEDRHDVRLYIMEFQDCKDGNITKVTKQETGLIFGEEYSETKSQVFYNGERVHFDDRVDALTLDIPKSAIIQSAFSKYVLEMTSEAVPAFEGADMERGQYALKGSFKKVDAKGTTLATGRILCSPSL